MEILYVRQDQSKQREGAAPHRPDDRSDVYVFVQVVAKDESQIRAELEDEVEEEWVCAVVLERVFSIVAVPDVAAPVVALNDDPDSGAFCEEELGF